MLPAYSAVSATTTAIGDRSTMTVTASDSEEFEYEEVEIEEEVEVEEEVTGDEEEDGDGEDLSQSIEDRYDEKGETTIISTDEKSCQCDGDIMTTEIANSVNESSKQMNASDKVPLLHSDEQTTQANTDDFNDAQQKETRLDFDPAMEIEGKKRPMCPDKLTPDKLTPDKLTDASDKDQDQQNPLHIAKSLSKKRKRRSKDRKFRLSDSGLLSGDGAGLDQLTTDDACHEIPDHTVRPGEIQMHVSDRARCSMVQAMGSVSQLIKCYDKKVETEKRLRERVKRYREKNLKNVKQLKKLKRYVRLLSEKENETLRMVAEKEAEHKKQMYDLMQSFNERK